MNYYNEIKNKLIDNEVYSNVKDYSKERHKVITYFEIGRLLTEAGGKYGDNVYLNPGQGYFNLAFMTSACDQLNAIYCVEQ